MITVPVDDDDDDGNDMESCGTRVSQSDHSTWEHPSYGIQTDTSAQTCDTNIH